jgi:hypothetical protein
MRSQTVTDISIGRDKIDTITARELAWKTHGTLYLDDLDQIELEPVTRF